VVERSGRREALPEGSVEPSASLSDTPVPPRVASTSGTSHRPESLLAQARNPILIFADGLQLTAPGESVDTSRVEVSEEGLD